jgi:hypothetical protein
MVGLGLGIVVVIVLPIFVVVDVTHTVVVGSALNITSEIVSFQIRPETYQEDTYSRVFVMYRVEVSELVRSFDSVNFVSLLVLSISRSISMSSVVSSPIVSILSVTTTSIVSIISVPGPVTVVDN